MRKCTLIFLLVNFWAFIIAQEVMDSSVVLGEHLIYFPSDGSQLQDSDVDSISNFISSLPDSCMLFVDAHTDPVGSVDYNMKLSRKRTSSVVEALKNLGFTDSLISSNFYGESRIAHRGSSESTNQLNRRARIRAIIDKKMIFLKGKVFDKEDKKGIQATVYLSSGLFASEAKTDTTGLFSIISPLDEEVTLEFLAKDYFIEANKIQITRRHIDLDLKIPLPKLELGKRYLFKNMLFEGNRSVMIPESESAAFHLKRFMDINPEVCILVAGHINLPSMSDVRKNSAHFELSIARAIEVKSMLVAEHVTSSRMLVKGYGNWEMKYPKAKTDREMELNRRVEIGVISCDKMGSVENDTLDNSERYKLHVHDRNFNKRLILSESMVSETKTRINLQVKAMIDAGMVPEKYSYNDILRAYPNLPDKK